MITTTISMTPYLAEYMRGKYNNGSEEPFQIPDSDDLYHLLWTLMNKRPVNASPVDEGNLVIALPDRRIGKDPAYYNYLAPRSQKIIEDAVSRLFNLELHQKLDENMQNGHLMDNIDVVHQFMCCYGIDSISEDALLKNYYRWREKVRQRERRREYKRKLNKC